MHKIMLSLFQAFPSVTPHPSSAPLVIGSRGWGSSQGTPSGSNLWAPSRQSGGQSGGSVWGPARQGGQSTLWGSTSSPGRQWGVSPSHHGDDPWLRFM